MIHLPIKFSFAHENTTSLPGRFTLVKTGGLIVVVFTWAVASQNKRHNNKNLKIIVFGRCSTFSIFIRSGTVFVPAEVVCKWENSLRFSITHSHLSSFFLGLHKNNIIGLFVSTFFFLVLFLNLSFPFILIPRQTDLSDHDYFPCL